MALEKIKCTASAVMITARWSPPGAACPASGTWSSRVHDSYVRQVRDLPAGGRPVVIRLSVRRFWCQNRACLKAVFAGQADGSTASSSQHGVAGLTRHIACRYATGNVRATLVAPGRR